MSEWRICKVIKAGATEAGQIPIHLRSDDAKNPKFDFWFTATGGAQREMLSVALTAMTSGIRVEAELEDPATEYTTIRRLYLSLV